MPSTITDRLYGLTTSVAVKAPCRVATTANITLSGTQTIDGIAVVVGDRVLAKDQTNAIDNGIWICGAGAWTRAADFDGTFDGVGGTQITVNFGTANAKSYWRVSANGPIVIGTDEITFVAAGTTSIANALGIASDATNFGAFDGTTIPDNQTGKQALQALETAVETKTTDTFSHATSYTADTVRAALKAFVSPSHNPYDAVGNGTANDSTPFSSAISAKQQIMLSSGESYSIKDIALSNSQSIAGIGQNVNAASTATNLFTLSDFNPKLNGLYISSATNCSGAAVKILASRYPTITDVVAVNCGAGFMDFTVASPTTTAVALPTISNCHAEGVTGTGVNISSSVSEIQLTNMHIYGQLTAGTGGDRPIFTTIGWRQNTPVAGGLAVGGHQIANANMITFNRGFYLTDAQLSKFSNCIADSCSDYGVLLDGACDYVTFSDLFVGTTRGVKIAGTSTHVHIDGFETILNGTIPPWGGTDFFNGVGTFYDLEVRDTASVIVRNWRGDKKLIVDSGASLVIEDGVNYNGRSAGTVAAGTTNYICEFGVTPTEGDAVWRAPSAGKIIRLTVVSVAAPGAGQTYTYTVRKGFAATSLTRTISGASDFGGETWETTGGIAVAKFDALAIELVTSAGATATRHFAEFQFLPD